MGRGRGEGPTAELTCMEWRRQWKCDASWPRCTCQTLVLWKAIICLTLHLASACHEARLMQTVARGRSVERTRATRLLTALVISASPSKQIQGHDPKEFANVSFTNSFQSFIQQSHKAYKLDMAASQSKQLLCMSSVIIPFHIQTQKYSFSKICPLCKLYVKFSGPV
jgi:hypothetical protein